MSRNLKDLNQTMQERAAQVVDYCKAKNVEILIYCTLRTCAEQARLYRQSRPFSQIQNKIKALESMGFDYLARVLSDVGPQGPGLEVTNAGPGQSFHQLGMAFDAVPLIGGKADWANASGGYDVYSQACGHAELYNLTWERPHAQQLPGTARILDLYQPEELLSILQMQGAI